MIGAMGLIRSRLGNWLTGDLRLSRVDGPPAQCDENGLTARCHRQWPNDFAFATAWDQLSATSPLATTFTSRLWQENPQSQNASHNSLRLVTVCRGPNLLAIVPLELTAGGFLETRGAAFSDYLDPLVSAKEERSVWTAIVSLLSDLWDRDVRALTLHNVRADNPCRNILPAIAAAEGFQFEETPIGNAAVLRLPRTWEQYLASLDGHERKELRRKIRKVEGQASARLLVCDDKSWDAQRLEQCLNLIEAADPDKRDWLRQNVRPFLSRIGERLVKARLMRLLMLLINEQPAACLIDLPSRRGSMLYNSGFDPTMRQWSPGIVTFGLAIRDAIERGQDAFDMLRGEHPYKYKLGAQDSALYRLTLSPR